MLQRWFCVCIFLCELLVLIVGRGENHDERKALRRKLGEVLPLRRKVGEVLCLVASIVLIVGRGENHDERKGRPTSGPGGPSGRGRV